MTNVDFQQCITMIRSDDPSTFEDGYVWIQDSILEHFDEIVVLLRQEQDALKRARFVQLIGDSMDKKAISILEQELLHQDCDVRAWAWTSLMSLGYDQATLIAEEYEESHPEENFYI